MSKSLITEPLGLYGWTHLEPAFLAALITEEPMLLVGAHGSAKSFLLERLAESLNMQFRTYNASLINYDDLVGIPMPDDTRTSLHYIASEESIWDAEVVFIDEINRTKPDLQNKLFPIIYDRRIQGTALTKLKYRWAAMNPPDNEEKDDWQYLGAEPLDAALVDRFSFIISVPVWDDLSDADRQQMLFDQYTGKHAFPIDIEQLISEGKEQYQQLIRTTTQQIIPYITTLVDNLHSAHYDVSIRRSTILHRAVLAVHAAEIVINKHLNIAMPTLFGSAQKALLVTLPDRAKTAIISSQLMQIAKQTWDVANMDDNNALKLLLQEPNPEKRLHLLLRNPEAYDELTIAKVVGECIAAIPQPSQRAWSLIAYLRLRSMSNLPATTIELLINNIRVCLVPQRQSRSANTTVESLQRCIDNTLLSFKKRTATNEMSNYLNNLLESFMPDGIQEQQVEPLANLFTTLWKEIL